MYIGYAPLNIIMVTKINISGHKMFKKSKKKKNRYINKTQETQSILVYTHILVYIRVISIGIIAITV